MNYALSAFIVIMTGACWGQVNGKINPKYTALAKVKAIETTNNIKYQLIFTYEVVEELSSQSVDSVIVSQVIDGDDGGQAILLKLGLEPGKEWKLEELEPVVIRFFEVPAQFKDVFSNYYTPGKWIVSWVSNPIRHTNMESLEEMLYGFYEETEDYQAFPDVTEFELYTTILTRERKGFLYLPFDSKVVIEFPYGSGNWRTGTFLKKVNRSMTTPKPKPHSDDPRIWINAENKERIYFEEYTESRYWLHLELDPISD